MKTLTKLFATLAVLAALAIGTPAQQAFLGQTTLAAAVQGQYLGSVSGANVPAPTLIQVASVTSIVGITPNLSITASQPNQTYIFVGREQMRVTAVNGTALTVVRGVNGTVAVPHPSGDMVLFGPARFFYVMDPGGLPTGGSGTSGVACTAANVQVSPWLNIRTGGQWLCSSVTGTWVPGWNNVGAGGGFDAATATVASAAGTITPSGPFFSMSGTNAITGFTTPVGFNATGSGGGCFVVNPTGIWTWTAAGNIAKAGTTTATLILVTFCWDAATSKWIPSRIA